MDCRGCRYYHNLADNHCLACDGSGYTRPSNGDRIRVMSDEQLATLISENIDCGVCENVFGMRPCSERCCPDFWLDWLKKEAVE